MYNIQIWDPVAVFLRFYNECSRTVMMFAWHSLANSFHQFSNTLVWKTSPQNTSQNPRVIKKINMFSTQQTV